MYNVYVHLRFCSLEEILRRFQDFNVVQCTPYLENDLSVHFKTPNYTDIIKILDLMKHYRVVNFDFFKQE